MIVLLLLLSLSLLPPLATAFSRRWGRNAGCAGWAGRGPENAELVEYSSSFENSEPVRQSLRFVASARFLQSGSVSYSMRLARGSRLPLRPLSTPLRGVRSCRLEHII